MARIRISSFAGMVPRVTKRHLDGNQAQQANNCLLTSGALGPWRDKLQVDTLATTARVNSIYLHGKGTAAERWLQWNGDVDAVRGPIAGDTTERTYFTGTGAPRVTNAALVDIGGNNQFPEDSYILGVPPSGVALTSALAGAGAGPTYSRAYVYTLVTDFGEESQPSPVSNILAWQAGNTVNLTNIGKTATITSAAGVATVAQVGHGYSTNDRILIGGANQTDYNGVQLITVTGVDAYTYAVSGTPASPATGTIAAVKVAATTTLGKRNVTAKRIYRVATSVTGAEYLFVAEIAVGTVAYNDAIADTALGEVLPSTDWAESPAGLLGLICLPNGVMAGFVGNELCLTPAYIPYAWPADYRITFKDDIVAISYLGTTIIVLTNSIPYIVYCPAPDRVSVTGREADIFPCVAKRSVVRSQYGVLYASTDGIVAVSSNGAKLITDALITRKEWDDYHPDSIHAYFYGGRYIGFYSRGLVGGVEDGEGFVFDPENPLATWTTLDQYAYAGHFEEQGGDLYLSYWDGGTNLLYQWNALGTALAYQWKSKLFQDDHPVVLTAFRVHFLRTATDSELAAYAAQRAAQIAANAAVFADLGTIRGPFGTVEFAAIDVPFGYVNFVDVLSASPQTDGVTFNYYKNGDLWHQETVADNNVHRMPGGKIAYESEAEVIGAATITEVELATTVTELAR